MDVDILAENIDLGGTITQNGTTLTMARTRGPLGVMRSNFEESVAWTDPFDESSIFRTLNFASSAGGSSISFSAVPGGFYRLQESTDLLNWSFVEGQTLTAHESEESFSKGVSLPLTPLYWRVVTSNRGDSLLGPACNTGVRAALLTLHIS